MTYTLNNNDLEQVRTEEHRQFSDLDYQSLPLATSSDSLVLDYQGVKRIITITGEISGTADEIRTFINNIEAIQTGNQITTVVYHSDLWNTDFNVKLDSFRPVYSNDAVGRLTYTIVLYEGL